LSAPTTKIDYGSIQLPEWEEKDEFIAKTNRLEVLHDRMRELSQKNPDFLTVEDAREVENISQEVGNLTIQLYGIGLTNTPGTALIPGWPITITLSSNPDQQPGEIVTIGDFVTALLPNGPSGTIGTLSPKTGTTSFDATFTPNGNYGTLTLQGKVGDLYSNVIIIEVTGQTKQQAETALQAYVDSITAHFQRVIDLLQSLAVIFGVMTAALIAFGVAMVISGSGAITGMLAIFAGLFALNMTLNIIEERRQLNLRRDEILRKIRAAARALIEDLPVDI
jgi:hypothetical protein